MVVTSVVMCSVMCTVLAVFDDDSGMLDVGVSGAEVVDEGDVSSIMLGLEGIEDETSGEDVVGISVEELEESGIVLDEISEEIDVDEGGTSVDDDAGVDVVSVADVVSGADGDRSVEDVTIAEDVVDVVDDVTVDEVTGHPVAVALGWPRLGHWRLHSR